MKPHIVLTLKRFRTSLILIAQALLITTLVSCGGSGRNTSPPIVVNSLQDLSSPDAATITLRSAIASAAPNQKITFAPDLDGGTINLSIIGEDHTALIGEVMGFDTANNISFLVGYFMRDYGRSALFAAKSLYIDASNLTNGITLNWNGTEPARVLAVDGNATLINVSITGGNSQFSEASDVGQHPDDNQTSTLARGGALAVWGTANLRDCTLYNNHAKGDDSDTSRDGGAYGGAVYADTVVIDNCTISGNTVYGGGAAGGGVFSVGGRHSGRNIATITRSTISENRISGLFAYGGGVYSDGGGIGRSTRLHIENSTVARNKVEPLQLPPFLFNLLNIGYWRGGGLYMSNGYMQVQGSTIVENQVFGKPRVTEIDKPNLAGGIAATIGNAHAVEDMLIGQSIIVDNTVHEIDGVGPSGYTIARQYQHDVFSGSVFEFRSLGHNRIGVIDFSQILVPIGEPTWDSLSRKHYPQNNDLDGVSGSDVLGSPVLSASIPSAGTETAPFAVLYYPPAGNALNQVPANSYLLNEILGNLDGPQNEGRNPLLLSLILDRIAEHYDQTDFASQFRSYFEDYLADIDPDTDGNQQYSNCNQVTINTLEQAFWCGPSQTWPQEAYNHAYIEFWHHLDRALAGDIAAVTVDRINDLGPALINDATWAKLFEMGSNVHNGITVILSQRSIQVNKLQTDQLGTGRPANTPGDIGAIESDD